MKLIFNIQSFSDIITNSSSELFVIETNTPVDELLNIIENIHEQFKFKGDFEEWVKLPSCERSKYDINSGEGGLLTINKSKYGVEIEIDKGFNGTINWIIKNLCVKDCIL